MSEWMTAEMVRLFQAMQQVKDDPDSWGPKDGECRRALHTLLGRECFESNVMDASDPEPDGIKPRHLADWRTARAIYVALEQAAASAPPLKLDPADWPAEQVKEWREQYDHAYSPDFPGHCIGHAKPGDTHATWLDGQAGIDRYLRWTGIPRELLDEWDDGYNRRANIIGNLETKQ